MRLEGEGSIQYIIDGVIFEKPSDTTHKKTSYINEIDPIKGNILSTQSNVNCLWGGETRFPNTTTGMKINYIDLSNCTNSLPTQKCITN